MSLVQQWSDKWRVRRSPTIGEVQGDLRHWYVKRQFNPRRRTNFYQALSNQVASGISLRQALETRKLIYSDDNKNPTAPMAVVVTSMLGIVTDDGLNTSQALRPWASSTEVSVMAAAESAGHEAFINAFARLVETMDRRSALLRAVFDPLKWGVVYVVASLSLLLGLTAYWAPMTKLDTPADKIQPMAAFLIALCDFTRDFGLFVVIGVVGLAAAIGLTLGRFDRTSVFGRALERVPPWTIYSTYQCAQFLFNIADLFASQTPMTEAMQILSDNGSRWLRTRLQAIKTLLETNGQDFGAALKDNPYGFPDRETTYFMADAGSVKDFKKAIDTFATRELDIRIRAIRGASQTLTNVLLVLSGAWMMFVFVATLTNALSGAGIG